VNLNETDLSQSEARDVAGLIPAQYKHVFLFVLGMGFLSILCISLQKIIKTCVKCICLTSAYFIQNSRVCE
jgi:hypothetical protein